MKIKKENTITRTEFENGVKFIHYYDALTGALYYSDSGGIKRCISGIYVCNVKKITNDGFHFFTFLFDVKVDGFVKFEHCIKI